ncbi:MAG: type II toxin-antitoxin system PrlF family antitoxin [Gammaproteobacteria bacterium]|nr:type II toxin-antitoxin system PrlF family antitoxin [Gammaproteobacteria bacterium]
MMTATLTSKGQVTVPKKIREILKLRPGDRLDFLVETDGTVRIAPVTASVKDLKGIVPKPSKSLSLEEMDRAIAAGAAKR